MHDKESLTNNNLLNLKNQYPNVAEQITIKTNNDTKFRIDAMAGDPATRKLIFE